MPVYLSVLNFGTYHVVLIFCILGMYVNSLMKNPVYCFLMLIPAIKARFYYMSLNS